MRGLVDAIRRARGAAGRATPIPSAFAQLADLYRKAGRTGEAVATCREGLRRWPHYTTAPPDPGQDPAGRGTARAPPLAEIAAILQTSPKDVQCHRFWPPRSTAGAGRLDAAVEHLEKAVAPRSRDRESTALLSLLRRRCR